MSGHVRAPAVAGLFYPAAPEALAEEVDALLEAAARSELEGGPLRALVAPHAGYAYSGPVAATAYVALRDHAPDACRIAVLGPAHTVPLRGSCVPSSEAWATPLGAVAIDEELRAVAVAAGARADDVPHAREHAVEVQLPFLQGVVGEALTVLPVVVGETAVAEAAALVAALWGSADALVVSTDLSHYLPDAQARERDHRTAAAIVSLRPDAIGPDDACGVYALRGLLAHAARVGARIRLLDLRTSADTAGGPDRVVGYGAFAVG